MLLVRVTCYIFTMPSNRSTHARGRARASSPGTSPAERAERSRRRLVERGGKLVQLRLAPDARRALAALGLASPGTTVSELVGRALTSQAHAQGIALVLHREDEERLADLALAPHSIERFRATGFPADFLAGVAITLASDPRLPRAALLEIARALAPRMLDPVRFGRWLEASPLVVPRFFKMVDGVMAVEPRTMR